MEPHVAFADDAANAAALPAAVAAEHPIHQVLRTCGITNAGTRTILIDIEGLGELKEFANLNGDGDIAARPSAAGRAILGMMHIKKLQALVIG